MFDRINLLYAEFLPKILSVVSLTSSEVLKSLGHLSVVKLEQVVAVHVLEVLELLHEPVTALLPLLHALAVLFVDLGLVVHDLVTVDEFHTFAS